MYSNLHLTICTFWIVPFLTSLPTHHTVVLNLPYNTTRPQLVADCLVARVGCLFLSSWSSAVELDIDIDWPIHAGAIGRHDGRTLGALSLVVLKLQVRITCVFFFHSKITQKLLECSSNTAKYSQAPPSLRATYELPEPEWVTTVRQILASFVFKSVQMHYYLVCSVYLNSICAYLYGYTRILYCYGAYTAQ